MKLPATAAALSLALTLPTPAQTPHQATFTDPANLRGERVSPRTGRELPIDKGALGLQQLLRKLNTRASLMLIVAHPDDEDGGMLTFLSRGLGARVADLSLTRGEGGQNAMTGDFEDALGLIRTQELLAADRYFGADQFFGTEVDFGFSKTKEEAFRKWTHERVLYDAVRAVRLYRPLVIAAVFIGGVTDGHGQHQVSGEIAQEVFKAAADPTVFPELTREGILPWAPLKVYARVPSFAITSKGLFDYATNQYVPPSFTNYVTGVTTTTPPTPDVVIHEGQPDPLLTDAAANPADLHETSPNPNTQLSYVQFARIGLGLQRTQIGPGVRLATPGAYDVAYHRYSSRLKNQPPHETSFFDGINTTVEGLATLIPSASRAITGRLAAFGDELRQDLTWSTGNPEQRSGLPTLLADTLQRDDVLLAAVEGENLPPDAKATVLHELRVKRVQLNDALILALGISVRTQLETSRPNECRKFISPACIAHIDTIVLNGPTMPVQVVSDFLSTTGKSTHPRSWGNLTLAPGERLRSESSFFEQGSPANSVTIGPEVDRASELLELHQAEGRPYFSRISLEQPFYNLSDPALRLAPATPVQAFWTYFHFGSVALLAGHTVTNSEQPSDPGNPLLLVPGLSLTTPVQAAVCPGSHCSVTAGLELRTASSKISVGGVEAEAPAGWIVSNDGKLPIPANTPGNSLNLAFTITPPAASTSVNTVRFFANGAAGQVREGYRNVGYSGLVPTPFYSEARLRIVPVDLKLPTHRRIAYLPGTGDAVADNLRSVGFEVTPITVADLTPGHLKNFDTVILGVRTYNAHPDLHGAPTQVLFDFARDGGNVIVQYQTAEFTAADAPFPLTLGNAEKVVDETTPVHLLDPATPALTTPNRITEADFSGWIEERGHGFLANWDGHYTPLTETHDPGAPAEHIEPQLPQEGGLLTTQLGKGHWTYCAFALYRQLPEAVPGAFRLLTNLVALADRP